MRVFRENMWKEPSERAQKSQRERAQFFDPLPSWDEFHNSLPPISLFIELTIRLGVQALIYFIRPPWQDAVQIKCVWYARPYRWQGCTDSKQLMLLLRDSRMLAGSYYTKQTSTKDSVLFFRDSRVLSTSHPACPTLTLAWAVFVFLSYLIIESKTNTRSSRWALLVLHWH